MSDKEQQETEQSGWSREAGLWLGEQWHRILLGVLVIVISYCICSPYLSPERRAANDHTALIVYLIGLAVTDGLVLCKPQIITSNPKKYFITSVLITGITGGVFALLLPIAVKSTTTGVGGLRHSILLATGGLLAILTLGETRRKNDNDLKAANELQIRHEETLGQQEFQFKMQLKEQQKQFDASAFKERKAERRERYTTAVEQLGSKEASVRMGGVYTLVGLVDEWLEEENLSEPERLKEGQVIINNLCAYIRSPLTLKSRMENFQPEADVRLGIIKEIHGRLQGSEENTPGTWSEFEYNFSGSRFFYSVDLTNSYYTKSVNFSGSTYKGEANFSGSTYKGEANFSDSAYENKEKNVLFSTSDSPSIYEGKADFTGSTYQGGADFLGSTYQGGAHFSHSTYKWANFRDSTYQGWANFSDSTYQGWANFSRSTYENETDFSGSIFYQETYFSKGGYSNSPSCFTNCAPQFYDKKNRKNTLFGSHNNDFKVDIDKGYPIDLDSKSIPINCKFLTSEQKEYLEGKLQEIEKIQNKLLEAKDPKEKVEISKKLRSFTDKLHEWREEATTVYVEDVAAEDTES